MASRHPIPNPSRQRLLAGGVFWLDLALATLAVCVIAASLNYLSVRHPWRMRWHQDEAVMLSPMTQHWVQSLTNDVRVVVFHDPDEKDTPHARIMGLLQEYRHHNSNIRLEVVDYLRQRSKAQAIKKQFSLEQEQEGEGVLFAVDGRHRMVSVKELTEYSEPIADKDGQLRLKAIGFKGEMLFTSAIMNLVERQTPDVYFLQGHGEHDPDSQQLDGYASFKLAMLERNIDLKPWNLRETGILPEDAAALVIAGSLREWTPDELLLLDTYLKQGGRALIAFNVQGFGRLTGLENWLRTWGIQVGQNVVDDVHQYSNGEILIGKMVQHPITNPLLGAHTPLVLSMPRSVGPVHVQPLEWLDVDVQTLATTTTNGIAKSGYANGTFYHIPRTDFSGVQIPLMVTMQATPSATSGLEQAPSRLVVLGDSLFLSNVHIRKQGNRDFAGLAMNWLLDRDTLMGGIGSKPLTEFRMDIPADSLVRLQWFMLGGLPLGVFGMGFLVWLRRRY